MVHIYTQEDHVLHVRMVHIYTTHTTHTTTYVCVVILVCFCVDMDGWSGWWSRAAVSAQKLIRGTRGLGSRLWNVRFAQVDGCVGNFLGWFHRYARSSSISLISGRSSLSLISVYWALLRSSSRSLTFSCLRWRELNLTAIHAYPCLFPRAP